MTTKLKDHTVDVLKDLYDVQPCIEGMHDITGIHLLQVSNGNTRLDERSTKNFYRI